MNYQKLSVEELNRFRYPNLVAEIIESGYSICTLAEHMGYGRREEDDPMIRGKVFGEVEITAIEGLALAKLFGCEFEYLFAEKLEEIQGKSIAHYRWYESNRRKEKDLELYRLAGRLHERMKKDKEIFMFMQIAAEIDMNDIKYEKLGGIA